MANSNADDRTAAEMRSVRLQTKLDDLRGFAGVTHWSYPIPFHGTPRYQDSEPGAGLKNAEGSNARTKLQDFKRLI